MSRCSMVTRRCRGLALALGAFWLARAPAPAQQPPAPDKVLAIVGATVVSVSGPTIHRGVVLVQKDKILSVGSELPIPEGAEVLRADGLWLSPGLVVLEATLGNAVQRDGNFADSLNPYHRDAMFLLASGITAAQVSSVPFFGFFGGDLPVPAGSSTAVVKSTYRELEGMLVKEPASVYLSFRRGLLGRFELRQSFQRAAAQLREEAEAQRQNRKLPTAPPELKLYVDALRGDLPVFCSVNDLESIRILIELRRAFGLRPTILGGEEAFQAASELAALDIPVALKARGPDFNIDLETPLFEGDEKLIAIRKPAALASVGVRVALLPYRRGVSLDGLPGRDLMAYPFEAAFAVRGGMDEAAALRAITLEPARLLRLEDRLGSLEAGKDADLVLWSGPPLHYKTYALKVWVNGKLLYEREKSRIFRDIPLAR